jgi:hypothetical protein
MRGSVVWDATELLVFLVEFFEIPDAWHFSPHALSRRIEQSLEEGSSSGCLHVVLVFGVHQNRLQMRGFVVSDATEPLVF